MVIKLGSQLEMSIKSLQHRALLWGAVGLVFLLKPSLTIVLVLLMAWGLPASSRQSLLGVLLLVALFLALVNVTKLPESDMANYLVAFAEAQQMDISSYLLKNTREPLYYISLYCLANLPGVDGLVYIFISTFLPYLIFGTGLIRLSRAVHIDKRVRLSVLIVLMFLPQLFSLSAHLFRQFLASSLIMLFMSEHAVTGRRRWGIGLLGVMVHYSAIPFLLLSFVKPLNRYSAHASVLFYALLLSTVYALTLQIAPLLLDVPVFGIVFQRLVNGEGAELQPLTLPALSVVAMILVISLSSLLRNRCEAPFGVQVWSLLFCTVIVCVVVLISTTQSVLSEIATRYLFYLYFLSGFLFVFLIKELPWIRWVAHGLALLALPLFFYRLDHGVWTFAPLSSLLVEPAWVLWGFQGNGYL